MGRYTTGARIWVGLTGGAALLLGAAHLVSAQWTLKDLIAFGVLALAAALAHGYPVKSIFDGASIRLTNVLVVAAAIFLPPWALVLLPVAAITPDSFRRRQNPGVWMRWTFNAGQTVLAGLATSYWAQWASVRFQGEAAYIVVMVSAALLFSLIQALMVGAVIALNSAIPFRQADTFTPPHLQSSVLISLLGALVGGLWVAKPALLILVLPLVVLAYFLSKSAHLSYLAQIDTKTGLHNYRHFEEVLEEELRRSHRLGRPLSLVFCDLDYLRNINNVHGHLAGDKVLQEVARILSGAVRKNDVVARFGGEEFVALLPGTDAEEAYHVAERIRETVAATPMEIEPGRSIHCTVSIGIAAAPDDAADVAGLIKQADLAMYRAKQTRNAVCRIRVLPPTPRIVSAQTGRTAGQQPAAPAAKSPFAGHALWGTVGLGALATLVSLFLIIYNQTWQIALPFVGLAIAAELFKTRVFEAKQEQISMSFAVMATMAAVSMVPEGAVLASLSAAAVHVLFVQRQRNLAKALFNLANPALAAGTAALLFWSLHPESGLSPLYLIAAALAVLVFHGVNFGLINLMISLHTGRPFRTLISASAWYSPTKLFLGLTGAYLAGALNQLGLTGVIMFALPLVILRYTVGLYAKQSDTTIAQLREAKAEVEAAHLKKEETLRQLIATVANIIDARDQNMAGHSDRVARYALALAQEMGLTPAELATIETAGLLHDLGKIAVPEVILNKPSRLTAEEYKTIKEHAIIGERILEEVRPLRDVARMVGEHHERWDGRGYPRSRSVGEISLGGRILCVADSLDTMLSDRPYSVNRGLEAALAEVDRCAGAQFDPQVVEALHRLVRARGREFFGQPAVEVVPDRLASVS